MVKREDARDLDAELWRALKREEVERLFDMVARSSWWVSPRVYEKVKVVYPKTRRYKRRLEKKGQCVGNVRVWANEPASAGFWLAQGSSHKHFSHFQVCHIYDSGVWSPQHFTNLANLTAVPESIASFTDRQSPINGLLRFHSYRMYGYKGPDDQKPSTPFYYPEQWLHKGDMSKADLLTTLRRLDFQCRARPAYHSRQCEDQ